MVRRPAAAARLQGRLRHPRYDDRRSAGEGRARPWWSASSMPAACCPITGSARSSRRSTPASMSRPGCTSAWARVPRDCRGRQAQRPQAARRPLHRHGLRHRQGHQAPRPARLLAVGTDCSVGKKYTALALDKEMRARGMKSRFPRHRPDRRPDLRARRGHRCGHRRFHRRRRRMADACQRSRPLGCRRRPGLAVPSLLRRRDARPAAWRAARCLRRLPRADAQDDARRRTIPCPRSPR